MKNFTQKLFFKMMPDLRPIRMVYHLSRFRRRNVALLIGQNSVFSGGFFVRKERKVERKSPSHVPPPLRAYSSISIEMITSNCGLLNTIPLQFRYIEIKYFGI